MLMAGYEGDEALRLRRKWLIFDDICIAPPFTRPTSVNLTATNSIPYVSKIGTAEKNLFE